MDGLALRLFFIWSNVDCFLFQLLFSVCTRLKERENERQKWQSARSKLNILRIYFFICLHGCVPFYFLIHNIWLPFLFLRSLVTSFLWGFSPSQKNNWRSCNIICVYSMKVQYTVYAFLILFTYILMDITENASEFKSMYLRVEFAVGIISTFLRGWLFGTFLFYFEIPNLIQRILDATKIERRTTCIVEMYVCELFRSSSFIFFSLGQVMIIILFNFRICTHIGTKISPIICVFAYIDYHGGFGHVYIMQQYKIHVFHTNGWTLSKLQHYEGTHIWVCSWFWREAMIVEEVTGEVL